jgi:hypothetical protein
MIWGEFINQLRALHVDFLDEFQIHHSVCTHDVELTSSDFPYPKDAGDFDEWTPVRHAPQLEESLELHSVERALIEGPLMPIQTVDLKDVDWGTLESAILGLEKQWLEKNRLFTPDHFEFIRKNLGARFVQLQRRSGRFALKAI